MRLDTRRYPAAMNPRNTGSPTMTESSAEASHRVSEGQVPKAETAALHDVPPASLNTLEDLTAEPSTRRTGQCAVFDKLDDLTSGKTEAPSLYRAVLNILEDLNAERAGFESWNKALLNILDDLNSEKTRLHQVNLQLVEEARRREEHAEQVRRLNATLERRIEEAAAANRELESFAYSISHDLRAPLRSIDGFSLVLMEDYADRLDDQAKDSLTRIRAAATRMGHLIDDILNLSRITRAEVSHIEVDLSALAQQIISSLASSDLGRHVEVLIVPRLVTTGDPRLLYQVLENLLNNAWKFTAKQPRAKIEFGAVNENNQAVYFVRDNGAGFDMAYVHKLFTPFQRLHAATEFAGTGVGLAIVRRIIHKHRGKVWAESAPGKGATFYFTLGGVPTQDS
jgi:light-regulated signal transduction histidine kinase (bacteriophytochrome)